MAFLGGSGVLKIHIGPDVVVVRVTSSNESEHVTGLRDRCDRCDRWQRSGRLSVQLHVTFISEQNRWAAAGVVFEVGRTMQGWGQGNNLGAA